MKSQINHLISYGELSFRKDKLYHGRKNTGILIKSSDKHPGLFKIRFPDGDWSESYNLTRAKDNAKVWFLETENALLRGRTQAHR